jgi:hypothetical protein
MLKSTIQDKINFFAHAGTQDVFGIKRKVSAKWARKQKPIIAYNTGTSNGPVVNDNIQLSLF